LRHPGHGKPMTLPIGKVQSAEKSPICPLDGSLRDRDRHRWDAVRILRNRMTHSGGQEIIAPAMAIDSLRVVAGLCSRLYPVASFCLPQSPRCER
jgi:hypothetical protein